MFKGALYAYVIQLGVSYNRDNRSLPVLVPLPAVSAVPEQGGMAGVRAYSPDATRPSNPPGVFQRCLPNGNFRAGLPLGLAQDTLLLKSYKFTGRSSEPPLWSNSGSDGVEFLTTRVHPNSFVAPPSSVVQCLWEVFVWGFGVLF